MGDTIYATATVKGRSGIAVVRLSGPSAFRIGGEISGGPLGIRRPSLRELTSRDKTIIDEAVVLGFAAGASFTGEDVVELQCHGSPAVIDALLFELASHADARLAEPGEFTRRALENGCLDLSQVEGLADLLEAETEAQRKQAFQIMQGGLSDKVEGWRQDLIRAAALVEATIDFADEDVPVDVSPEVLSLVSSISSDLDQEIKGSFVAERIRDGFEVAIIGPPNAGKSTLLNTLAGREAAITSEIAGTTRDVIEVRMDLDGLAVTLLDTAGLRDSDDQIEGLGIDLARRRAKTADIRVFLTDGNRLSGLGLEPEADDIVVLGKSDLREAAGEEDISGKSGFGVDRLVDRISQVLSQRSALAQSAIRQRHRLAMERAVQSLAAAKLLLDSTSTKPEFLAMELNSATTDLSSLIGKVDVEDLLDEIFASFCLGK